MPTNDFLPFGTAPGANVTDQATWNGLAARTAGFSAGVASSAQINKALRQSSFVASVVAQFVADLQAGNVADDGVIANFETQLKNAIVAQAATAFTGTNVQKSLSGYQKLPGGLALQWFSLTTPAGGQSTPTYPFTFPNGALSAVAVANSVVNNASYQVGISSVAASSCVVTTGVNGAASGLSVTVWVIGY